MDKDKYMMNTGFKIFVVYWHCRVREQGIINGVII